MLFANEKRNKIAAKLGRESDREKGKKRVM
jgi:hypothetical protein